MKQETTRQKIYLAALLHDIGKFYQRADNKKNGSFEFLKDDFWNKPESYCPTNKYGGYSHKHVIWTAQFIQEHAEIFNKLNINAKDGENSLTLLAASHHNPSTELEKIIQLADWYSSAVDRSNEEFHLEDDIDGNKWDSFKKRSMVSVFEGILQYQSEVRYENYQYFFPVKALELSDSLFPKRKTELSGEPDYSTIWTNFVKDFKKIPTTSFDVFAETLLSILHKYTVTVPSSTNHLPDVSLFDHAKTTAAFAVAIYDFYAENKRLPKTGDTPLNLVGADISGIQKFIYDVISKNAAKNLKGRSFYLQLLVDTIMRYTLKELNLYSANVVYSSGGGFYILASNTKDFQEKLNKIETVVSDKLFEAHKTTLFVAISSEKLSHNDLLPKDNNEIGERWRTLMEKINTKKRQRYANKLVDEYDKFFEPIEQGGESKNNRDAIDGQEFKEDEPKYYILENSTIVSESKIKNSENEKAVLISKNTAEQILLGKDLRDADYWIISQNAKDKINANAYEPLNLGIKHFFLSKLALRELSSIPDNSIVLSINEPDFTVSHNNAKYAVGFSFYGGNTFPADEKGEPKYCDDLVGSGDFKRLGILRMDVDNLGQIFINGLSEQKRTFSRYSTLSRNLDYFFTGYLNKIQQQEKYEPFTYILYSGGDDLFILGKWDLLIEMAKEIQEKFAAWTCHNPKLSLSGGISIVTPKFPILKAAIEAEGEEKNAKSYINEPAQLEKNAFSLWGNSLSWQNDYEFDVVLKLKNRILKLLKQEKGLPKSFIGNISAFSEKRNRQIKKAQNQSWQWQMAYQLARFAKNQTNEEIQQLIDEIKINVFINKPNGSDKHLNYKYIELLNIATRWAELELRTNNKK